MTATPASRRRGRAIGLGVLLVVAVLGGLTSGWTGALMLAALFMALSAGWGVVTTRTWWGPMPRGRAAAVGGGALVALVVVAAVAAPDTPSPDDGPAAAPSAEQSAAQDPDDAPRPRSETSPGPDESSAPPATEESTDRPEEPAAAGTALAALADLDVKGRAPKTGYDRDEFGAAWSDVDRNGCDTRNDVLRRDLTDVTTRAGTHGCVVLGGDLDDPYTGTSIDFRRGQATSAEVQIDHVVALSDAWQKGAQQLSADDRRLLANDPLNLLASDGPANMSKGDGDAATWLPPHKAFRCSYVARQVAVKARYDLWVTGAERDAVERVLTTCPDKKLPSAGATAPAAPLMPDTAVAEEPAEPPAPEPEPEPAETEPPAPDPEVYYENCDAVRAAGAAPIHRGDPGYSGSLDRDGDGVACE